MVPPPNEIAPVTSRRPDDDLTIDPVNLRPTSAHGRWTAKVMRSFHFSAKRNHF